MISPKFKVEINEALDKSNFLEFFNLKTPLIFEFYPFLKSKEDVEKLAKYLYKNKIDEILHTKRYLESRQDDLKIIAKHLANLTKTDWQGIENITIIPTVSPVCPRFIETNSFMVTYFYNKNAILRICAHEMSHFVYFKKLHLLFPSEDIDTEYPSKDWLLSEIVAPLLINSKEIQKIIKQDDVFYALTELKNINDLLKNIKRIFDNRYNFEDFVIEARQILQNIKSN